MKVVLITGASSGIGYEAAQRLARRGCRVYAAARRVELMEPLRKEGIVPVKLDVCNEESMRQCVDTVLQAEGRIDVLVNNAGYGYFGGILLGASGLANAYKTAARDAIDHAQIIEKTIDARYRFLFAYEAMNDVMRILKEFDLKPENQQFDLDCSLEVSVRQSQSVRLYDRIADLRTVRIEVL